jgi:hypothetical protein
MPEPAPTHLCIDDLGDASLYEQLGALVAWEQRHIDALLRQTMHSTGTVMLLARLQRSGECTHTSTGAAPSKTTCQLTTAQCTMQLCFLTSTQCIEGHEEPCQKEQHEHHVLCACHRPQPCTLTAPVTMAWFLFSRALASACTTWRHRTAHSSTAAT